MDYNLTVQHQLTPNTVMEIAYVGNQEGIFWVNETLNQPTLAARAANPTAYVTAVVPYAGYSAFVENSRIHQ